MRRAWTLSGVLALAACGPRFDEDPARITGPAVLAVRSDPPEVAPGEAVTLRALVVDASGPADGATVAWAFCRRPRDPATDAAVSPDCLEAAAPWIAPIATAAAARAVTATVPPDACALFGSQPPPPPPGEPPRRPADPDPTGGWYQPVRVATGGVVAFGRIRLRCPLAAAPVDVSRAFEERSVPNRNPTLESPPPARAPDPGETLDLRAAWDPGDAEPYVVYDPERVALARRVEEPRAWWFATGGTFARHRTAADARGPFTENAWTAPDRPGPVHIWVVLRDGRGGVDWWTLRPTIEP